MPHPSSKMALECESQAKGEGWSETILYNFTNQNGDGGFPNQLTAGADGVLYGTTAYGGVNGDGAVFELRPPSVAGGAWSETIIHSFDRSTDGFSPSAGVIVGKGVLYGATPGGGPYGSGGTVFVLSPPTVAGGAGLSTVLHAFNGSQPDGGTDPQSQLTLSREGILYGTTGGYPRSSLAQL